MEVTENCSPWLKGQVVVALSRNCRARDFIIVGDKDDAISRLWELLTISTQWTDYIELLLGRLTENGEADDEVERTMEYADVFPYRTCDITPPNDNTGYVYFLVSVWDFDRDYIGQTTNLGTRITQHNNGSGAVGTEDPFYRPYSIAAYICGLSHMSEREREGLEYLWKLYCRQVRDAGRSDIMVRIDQGRRIVSDYNRNCPEEEHIRLVVTIRRKVAEVSQRIT
jgi:predicted GIY-YIG superfamily endonuclease